MQAIIPPVGLEATTSTLNLPVLSQVLTMLQGLQKAVDLNLTTICVIIVGLGNVKLPMAPYKYFIRYRIFILPNFRLSVWSMRLMMLTAEHADLLILGERWILQFLFFGTVMTPALLLL